MLRLRGIFSTALAGLLSEAGYSFSDVSEQIKSRIPLLKEVAGGARLTVKDLDSHKGLLLVGDKQLVLQVCSLVAAVAGECLPVVIEDGPYTVFRARVLSGKAGGYEVELPGGRKGFLRSSKPHSPGELVTVHVIKPDARSPILEEGVAVTGEYARVVEGARHSVSEHVRDAETAMELLALAARNVPEGWGVRFRSSAKKANILDVLSEVKALLEKARSLKLTAERVQEPALLKEGETLAFLYFSPGALFSLDRVRARYHPTATAHHLLKSLGSEEVNSRVDSIEASGASEDLFGWYVEGLRRLVGGGWVRVVHEKPTGGSHTWAASASVDSSGWLRLERRVESSGVYDGMGLRKEPGDTIVSLTYPFSRFVVHQYFDATGKLKGVYVNLNTPLDFTLSPPALWYLDVLLDVVWTSDAGARVIDEEEFQALRELGLFPNPWLDKYLEAAHILREALTESPANVISSPLFLVEIQERLWGGRSETYSRVALQSLGVVHDGRPVGAVADEVH